MRKITQAGNGNGHGEYNPEVEFRYLDADVWVKETPEGQEVAYTEDVLDALKDQEEDEESDSEDQE